MDHNMDFTKPVISPGSILDRSIISPNGTRVPDPHFQLQVNSVNLRDMAVGNICWLTEQGQIHEDIMCTTKHKCEEVYMRDDAFRHPIVILGMHQRPGSRIPGDVIAQFCVVRYPRLRFPMINLKT